jgi:hypothetical protein
MRRLPIATGIDMTAHAGLAAAIGNVRRFFIQQKLFDAASPRQLMTIALEVLGAELRRPAVHRRIGDPHLGRPSVNEHQALSPTGSSLRPVCLTGCRQKSEAEAEERSRSSQARSANV